MSWTVSDDSQERGLASAVANLIAESGGEVDTAIKASYGLPGISFTDPRVGGVLDGTTDNGPSGTNAFTKAFALLSSGGTLFFPPGVALVSSQFPAIPSKIRLVGSGKNASIIRKGGNFDLLQFNGASTSSRCQRGGLRDLCLDGGGHTGRLITTIYADHLDFDTCYLTNNADVGVYASELWDTYFKGVEFEFCSGTDGTKPSVLLTSSATDSTNEVWFAQCRWESFKDGALWLATGGVSSANNCAAGAHPIYGVYVTDAKMESAYVRGSFVNYSNDVTDVHFDKMYLAADSLDSGLTSANAPNLVNFISASFCSWSRVHAYVNNNAARTIFRMFPGSPQSFIKDVQVDAVTSLGTAIMEWAGGNPAMHIASIRYKSGTGGAIPVYSGAQPTNVINEDWDSYGTAAPTSGTWQVGARVWNSAPTASGVPGWICVASGTPGTWKAMANLAA